MRVAILGATGCVGRSLTKKLIKSKEHEIIASYRSVSKIDIGLLGRKIEWRRIDVHGTEEMQKFLQGVDVLVYLIHSLESSGYERIDLKIAHKVANAAKAVGVKKIIYLSGIIPKGRKLSHHLKSRVDTGLALAGHGISVGEVRASILLGAGSASYRIVHFLAKCLPLLVTPRCLNSLCTPIALEDAVDVIRSLINRDISGHEVYEIGSDILRYRDIVSLCGKIMHGYKTIIITVPLLTMPLSVLWIRFITGTSRNLARALTESLTTNTIYTHNSFKDITGRNPIPIEQALRKCIKDMKTRH